ncbi:MAG: tRNA (adenosine(37)-N6)-dimethylallyltransferase MiaA [Candidatus Melainabacteria bacterium]|nr:tRNA (adenosine(37)-N6)-dimethylallyltransferase MiaA [Candidatus Melainabacteria bacterium]
MASIIDSILNYIDTSPKKLITILGPTCTGKTDIAIELAKKFKTEIINADSRLIFKEMDIGTAKPSFDELKRVKHHLVNFKSMTEAYSAGDYQKDFDNVVKNIWNLDLDKKIILVGGTGLYIKAALENLEMPAVNTNQALRDELNQKSLEELLLMLQEKDSGALALIDIQNKVRVIRALELVISTGKPLRELRTKSQEPRYDSLYVGLDFKRREDLYDLINARVLRMIERGLVDEVKALINKYGRVKTIDSTIGYREVADYLSGILSLDEAINQIQLRTRRYAKRQMTWFRANPEIQWFYR